MPKRQEKQRRKSVIKSRPISSEEAARRRAEFEQEVILKPEYYDVCSEADAPPIEDILNPLNRKAATELPQSTTKMLGDAGEHYALSRFGFMGMPCAKMPENWPGYDLVLDTKNGLIKIGVKTRSQTPSFTKGSWFGVDASSTAEWSVFIIKFNTGRIRAWVVPQEKCMEHATPKHSTKRHISWKQLEGADLERYEENWGLDRSPPARAAVALPHHELGTTT